MHSITFAISWDTHERARKFRSLLLRQNTIVIVVLFKFTTVLWKRKILLFRTQSDLAYSLPDKLRFSFGWIWLTICRFEIWIARVLCFYHFGRESNWWILFTDLDKHNFEEFAYGSSLLPKMPQKTGLACVQKWLENNNIDLLVEIRDTLCSLVDLISIIKNHPYHRRMIFFNLVLSLMFQTLTKAKLDLTTVTITTNINCNDVGLTKRSILRRSVVIDVVVAVVVVVEIVLIDATLLEAS